MGINRDETCCERCCCQLAVGEKTACRPCLVKVGIDPENYYAAYRPKPSPRARDVQSELKEAYPDNLASVAKRCPHGFALRESCYLCPNQDLSRSFTQGAVDALARPSLQSELKKLYPDTLPVKAKRPECERCGVQMFIAADVDAYECRLCKAREQLAASEKEHERLKGELEKLNSLLDVTVKPLISDDFLAKKTKAAMAETEKLRRELENLKRSTAMELGDLRCERDCLKAGQAMDCERIGELTRELDRERAKMKKRGL
jgi:ribosomal protein S27AE